MQVEEKHDTISEGRSKANQNSETRVEFTMKNKRRNETVNKARKRETVKYMKERFWRRLA